MTQMGDGAALAAAESGEHHSVRFHPEGAPVRPLIAAAITQF